jgi:hypothetical protein
VSENHSSPLVFLRPVGIAAADALRLMDSARSAATQVRWRMTPPGVAADAYLVHKHSIVSLDTNPESSSSSWGTSKGSALPIATGYSDPAPLSVSSTPSKSAKLTLDQHGWHRGRPVCVLGKSIDTSQLGEDDLAPLSFPESLQELQKGLKQLLLDMVGLRMLYVIGSQSWEQRQRWHSHRLHAIESGQLIAVIEPQHWRFHLLSGCTVDRMEKADVMPMPRSGAFEAEGFEVFPIEVALWEFAKRCPENLLTQILPARFLQESLTHRRIPHLKEHSLGEHCVAILRILDTRSRTATEIERALRMTRSSLLRALTCLALVRAIQPESHHGGWGKQLSSWWGKLTGRQGLRQNT